MSPTLYSNRNGFTLPLVLVALAVLTAAMVFLGNYLTSQAEVVRSQESQAMADLSAESVTRMMVDRLAARAEQNLGKLDEDDLAALNAELEELDIPEGMELDLEASGYTITSVRDRDRIPQDERSLRAISDQVRTDAANVGVGSAREAVRSVEIAVIATVSREPQGRRTNIARLTISRTTHHQRAIELDGDFELCVSDGSELLVEGAGRTTGQIISACDGSRSFAGDLSTRDGVALASGPAPQLLTAQGPIELQNEDGTSDSDALIASYGGRLQVAAATGGRFAPAPFQTTEQVGSGECPDFDAACAGEGLYSPAILIEKTDDATSSSLNSACGAAYERVGDSSGCVSQVAGAVQYVPFPFSSGPTGTARTLGDGSYWNGLFPDPLREAPCTVEVDGVERDSYRCDTNAYGYVLDLGALGAVPGGLISIRRTETNAETLNPSGYQEVLVIRNARALTGPVTIHTDLPTFIAGSFNDVSRVPAMIDAPMISLLPEDYASQTATREVWDDVPPRGIRAMRSANRHRIHAILRSDYPLSDEGSYYGGTVESLPRVLGDFSAASVEVYGAVEGRAQTASGGAIQDTFMPYGTEPAPVATRQPYRRIISYNRDLIYPDYQPPGSWSPENFPVDAEIAGRTQERQANAQGGTTMIRLTQEPTRLPRAEALAMLPTEITCPDCDGPIGPPQNESLSCTPSVAYTGDPITCTATGSGGDYPLADFTFYWGDSQNSNSTRPASSGSAESAFTYGLPGEYTIRSRARDTQMNVSAELSTSVSIEARPPEVVSGTCDPNEIFAGPPGSGELTDCLIEATAGSYPIDEFHWDWGDGRTTTLPATGSLEVSSQSYENPGTYEIEMWVVDSGGYSSDRVTDVVEVEPAGPIGIDVTCPSSTAPTESFNCIVSFPENGSPHAETVEYDFGDGTTGSVSADPHYLEETARQATAPHAYHTGSETADQDQAYTAMFRGVTDVGVAGPWEPAEIAVETVLPTADISCAEASVLDGSEVSCTSSASGPSTFDVQSRQAVASAPSGSTTSFAAGSGYGSTGGTFTPDEVGTWQIRTIAVDERGNEVESAPFALDVAFAPPNGSVDCELTTIELDGRMRCRVLPVAGTNPVQSVQLHFSNGKTSDTFTSNLDGWRIFEGFGTTGDFDVHAEIRDIENEVGYTTATDFSVILPDFSVTCDSPVELDESVTCTVSSPLSVLTNPGNFTLNWDTGGAGPVDSWTLDPGAGYTVAFDGHTSTNPSGYSTSGDKEVRLTFNEHNVERTTIVTVVEEVTPEFTMSCSPTSINDGDTVFCTGTANVEPDQVVWRRRHAHNSTYTIVTTDTSGSTSSSFSTVLLNNDGGTENGGVRATASFSGYSNITRTRLISVTGPEPAEPEDEIDVTISCSPTTIPSGGTVNCTASLSDNPDEVRWQTTTSFGTYQTRQTDTSGSTSSSFSYSGFTNTTSSSITRRIRARAYLGSAIDNSSRVITIEPESSASQPTVSCSVAPAAPDQGSSASLAISYDGEGANVTNLSWSFSGANSGSGSTSPNNESGGHTTSAPTTSDGTTNVSVTATNSEGSTSGSCSYTVEPVQNLDVSLSCSMTGSGTYEVGENASMSCTATSNLSSSSFSFSGGGCQGASGSGTSASCNYGSLDTSSDGSHTAPVSVQVTHSTAGNSPASASQSNPYEVEATQVWSCSISSPSPQGQLGSGDGWATGNAINTASDLGFTTYLACPSCDLASNPSYTSQMGAGNQDWHREGYLSASGGGSFWETGGVSETGTAYNMRIVTPEPNPGESNETYSVALTGPDGDFSATWGSGSLSATVMCSYQDP